MSKLHDAVKDVAIAARAFNGKAPPVYRERETPTTPTTPPQQIETPKQYDAMSVLRRGLEKNK